MTHKKIDPLDEEMIQSMTDQIYMNSMNHVNSISTRNDGFFNANYDILRHTNFPMTGMTMTEQAQIVKDTIDRMKLINMLSDDKKVKWLEEHPEDYVYVIEPSSDVRNMKTFKEEL